MSAPGVLPSDFVVRTRRSRLGSLLGTEILAVGGSVPDLVVENEDLAGRGFDPDWIFKRTGICRRRHVPAGVCTSDLAVEAAEQCIARADVDRAEIDLVVVATYTPDMPMPSTAALVQDRLGLTAMAFDLQSACTGFVFGLLTAAQYVATCCSRTALLIGAECNSRIINPADKQTYPLFGDGAGAVLLGRGQPQQGILGYAVGADGSGASLLARPAGGALLPAVPEDDPRRYLTMVGRPVYKWAIRIVCESIQDALRVAQVTLDEVDVVLLHQANMRIIDAVTEHLGLDPDKLVNNLQDYGNTAAASIPLVMDEAIRQGRLRRGSLVLLSGFGGGLSWGSMLLRW